MPDSLPRWVAASQALLVSGVPTQVLVFAALYFAVGLAYLGPDGQVAFSFFVALSLVDTLLVIGLIAVFLLQNGEDPRHVFLGVRRILPEAVRGLLFVPVVFLVVALLVLALRTAFPWMHTVEQNPLEAFMRTPGQAAVFLVVVVLAGGVREELQRAFILHRFERYLGGIHIGLVLFTLTFGALHLEQGIDVAVAIGVLGLWWGLVYIRRRSAVLPLVNHAGFNALQVFQAVMVKAFGG